jgi:hypothetical protein
MDGGRPETAKETAQKDRPETGKLLVEEEEV